MGFSSGTQALLDRLRGRDHERVGEAGRTSLLLHGEVRPHAIVLFHGLSASPTQFVRFAHALHAHGHNVIVPRLPRHGHRDRLSEALAHLTADELRAFARESVELAQGLGDRVIVAGFSIGGLLATWIAERYPIEHAVAIAPFFGISWVPSRLMGSVSRLLLAIPNRFEWWDPFLREKQMPAHGYPRYATHALAQAYMLACEVMDDAPKGVAAKHLTLVTNARETAVNNRAVRRLEARLRTSDPARLDHVALTGIPFSHDIIEPLRHPKIAETVFPRLLGLIEDPLGP
ncbi:MAG TPA: alpha/beta fold hydrolase [Candidatus Baltobacteraceae bacterium]|nr:alpha/beta fold hydrolase [Candidatus Baltobacteraceae bacterium]